ncbi:MAG: type transport system permease protein [Candidatus Sumerlaeota bacterium]|nr:type transport system permease protein [Candidatus Sumerlaeota bacterium]
MRHNSLILWTKWRSARNAIRNMEGVMKFHVSAAFIVLSVIVGAFTFVFWRVFAFLMDQAVFGPPLMDRLVGIVFLAFFSMLVFSNLIITLSTTYISREVDFLMVQPIGFSTIFRQKLLESIVYSSWAFALLSLPFFLAFGISRQVGWHFYPLVILLLIPFLTIPAALGSIVTMLVTAFLPARRTRTLVVVLAVMSAILAYVLARLMNFRALFQQAEDGNFTQIMSFLEFGSSPLVPSSWMMKGLLSIAPGTLGSPDFASYLYWLGMLSATALFLIQVNEWLVPSLYYRGWCLTKDSGNSGETSRSRFAPLNFVDRLLRVLPVQLRALFSKDMKTFWRDPAQWTQLVILMGLMAIYIANLRSARRYSSTVEFLVTDWKAMLSLFNLGATCFILSILTTRFVYPMLSLEGRQFWSVGLAPMKRATIVWQKYSLCLVTALLLAVGLLTLSNQVLRVEPYLRWISLACTVVMAFALSSLSIGFGALLPNFREDNPARIANGIGGTANALLSMAYIGVTLALVGMPIYLHSKGELFGSHFWNNWAVVYIAGGVLFQLGVIFVPMVLGLRKWNRLEF